MAENLELYFKKFRDNIIGINQQFTAPTGIKRIVYADWTASGRLHREVEEKLLHLFGPFVGNTHTETSVTGTTMTTAYKMARNSIKAHVGAASGDCILMAGSGMTGVINKFQRILGLKIPDHFRNQVRLADEDVPVVFITHMEHHSNQTSWLETIAQVEVIQPTAEGLVDLEHLSFLLEKFKMRKTKIAAVTACSNVTGIETPYRQIASLMHAHNGFCFVDFACSAPYVEIKMHTSNPLECLDAIYFSPHKFLGGPGTPGVLVFNSKLYHNRIPDQPGGGTVKWTNPWKEHEYIDDIEDREDGGTPAFLQTIKTALCFQLKAQMGVQNILEREEAMLHTIFKRLEKINNLHLLAGHIKKRLGVISFYIDGLHYNLGVQLLNDYFGIQARGGCSCAGTYGHYLLHVSPQTSHKITEEISSGDLSSKPGWIRISIHPTMTDEEITFICDGIEALAGQFMEWGKDYVRDKSTNEFHPKHFDSNINAQVKEWFQFRL